MTRKHGFSILSVVESFVFKLSRLTLIAQTLLRASTNIFALEGLAIMVKETQTKGQLRRLFYTCFAFTELRKIKMITRVMNARIRVTQVVPLRSLSAVDPAQSLPTLRGSIQTRIQIQSVPNLGKNATSDPTREKNEKISSPKILNPLQSLDLFYAPILQHQEVARHSEGDVQTFRLTLAAG